MGKKIFFIIIVVVLVFTISGILYYKTLTANGKKEVSTKQVQSIHKNGRKLGILICLKLDKMIY